MDSKQAFREVREGNVRPVYICYGTEKYLIQEFANRLAERLVPPEHRDMALFRFDTAETPIDAIVEEAQTPPFLAPGKLVLVKDGVLFASGQSKLDHQPERLMSYMADPLDSTVLVFQVPHEKLDERKKLVKLAKSKDAAIAFAPLNQEELAKWAIKRAKDQGRTMEPSAVEELLRRIGADMGALAGETDKLCLHAGDGGRVTAETVAELVPMAVEQNVFKLTEELAARRTDRVMALYYDLLRQREEPIKLSALIVRHIRNMLNVKELAGQGYPPQQIAGQLGLHPYAVKVTSEQARGFATNRLAALLDELAELDYEMKTGKVDKALGLELFLLRTSSAAGTA